MIDRLIVFAMTQRMFILLLVAALIGFGGYAINNLPIEAFPDVQDVQVRVISQMSGQAPEDIERTISLPIEREMAGVPNLVNVRSVTMTGLSIVTLTFSEGTNNYFARQQVTEKLSTVNLPAGVQPQLAPLSTAVGEVYRYTIDAPGLSDTEIRTLQDWTIRPALRMTPGVADVVSFGGAIKEFHIEIDPLNLRKYQITLNQLSQAVSNGNSSAGGGLIKHGDESFVVRSAGLFATLDDIRKVVIIARQGQSITVGDVAIVKEAERPRFGIVAFDNKDSIVEGIVSMTKGGNPSKINAALKERIAELQTKLPVGVKIVPIYDRTELVTLTVNTVVHNLIVGALLVFAVLVVFLSSWLAAFVVATVIPLSLLFAFILMNALGVSANLISLGAVDFGIIIDSAVVIVEALMVRLALSSAKNEASSNAAISERMHAVHRTLTDMSRPVLFSKAIIILAFVPIFTFQRVEGKIFTPVALTLTFALIGAVLLTFTLLPTLLAYVVRNQPLVEKHKPWLDSLQERYRTLIVWVMGHARKALLLSIIPVVVAFALAMRMGSEFMPKLDEGNIWLSITLPTSSSLEHTKDIERLVRAKLLAYPEVSRLISHVGRPDDGSDPKGPNNLESLVDLKPRDQWRFANKEALVSSMSKDLSSIPGIMTNFSQVIQDNVEESLSGFRGEIVAKISGASLEILEEKAAEIVAVIEHIRGATDVEATKLSGQSEVVVVPDRAKLARYGISISDVSTLVTQAMSGVSVTSFYDSDKRFDVVVKIDREHRNSIDSIAALQLEIPGTQVGNGSGTLALGDVASVEVREGASRILREAGTRIVIVKMNLLGRDQGSFVAEAQKKVQDKVKLPPGYELSWGGQFENSQRATKRLTVIIPLTLLLIFSLLFWAFRSLRMASLVIGMLPFTLIGGLAALSLAGLNLSVSAAVGFIAVAGISVQNSVIMAEEVIMRLRQGQSTTEAILEGAVSRLRPILMTALMAGLGLLPAALSQDIGSETNRPFACVIVGGITTGTIFMLLILPAALKLFGHFTNTSDEAAELLDDQTSEPTHG
ncbi:MAG: CusA/CzcA family heavy metal efflux RND transporter [Alcaligenaceae bacterium]